MLVPQDRCPEAFDFYEAANRPPLLVDQAVRPVDWSGWQTPFLHIVNFTKSNISSPWIIRTTGILGALVLAGEATMLAKDTSVPLDRSQRTEDTGLNNPEVPAVYSLSTDFERVVVLRIKKDEDLLEGMKAGVVKEGIANAVILSGIGSLTSFSIHVVSNTTFPSTNEFLKSENHPCDITSVQGYIVDGRIHSHVTLADASKAFGGHLEKGSKVFTFAIVTLGVLPGHQDLKRFDDKTWR